MAVLRTRSSRADIAVVTCLCAFGAAIRIPGLTSRDLWFDDSWAALPAHVSLHDALRMVVTTPLYTLAMRTWIGALPQDTWWAQLPALVLGVVGIAAVWAIVRAHGYSRLAAFVGATLIAVGPVTVTYSARVKEYSADLLLACLVLWLVERWRRSPSSRSLTALAVASVGALWISASTAAVVGGAAATTMLVAWSRPELRRQVGALLGALVVGAASVWVVFLRHLPGQLRTNWRTHGYLVGYSSARHVAYSFQQTFAGVAHGLFGLPIAYTFQGYSLRAWPLVLASVTFLALACAVVAPLGAALRTRGAGTTPTTASAATICLAVIGTLAGVAPFGDGRTDEALYPALVLLGVGAASALASRASVRDTLRHSARVALVGVIAVVAMVFGLRHLAEYPPTGLRTVWAQLQPLLRPGDLVVVDGYEQFTWADEGLEPWRASFQRDTVPWPMGFHVVSASQGIDLSPEYLQPDPQLPALVANASRVWLIGPTVGGFSTSAPKALWNNEFPSPTVSELEGTPKHPGLLRIGKTFFESGGAYVQLFVHPSRRS